MEQVKVLAKAGLIGAIIGNITTFQSLSVFLTRHPEDKGFNSALLESFLDSPFYILGLFSEFGSKLTIFERFLLTLTYFTIGAAFGQIYFELKNPAPLFDRSRIKVRILALVILAIYFLITAFAFLMWLLY